MILWRYPHRHAPFPRGVTERPALLLVKLANDVMARAEDPLAALGLSGRQYTVLAMLAPTRRRRSSNWRACAACFPRRSCP